MKLFHSVSAFRHCRESNSARKSYPADIAHRIAGASGWRAVDSAAGCGGRVAFGAACQHVAEDDAIGEARAGTRQGAHGSRTSGRLEGLGGRHLLAAGRECQQRRHPDAKAAR